MNKARKAQLAWWAAKVREQATMYAELSDPARKQDDEFSPRLDRIASMCRDIVFQITGKMPD